MHPEVEKTAKTLGLSHTSPLDVHKATNTSEMLRQMSGISFTGRSLGEAADVMEAMLRDPDCAVVLTLSGAMTMGGLTGLIMESLRRGWIQCIISTGALIGHGMVEDLGMVHYKADLEVPDEEYFLLRMDRVYDTIEPEQNLDDLEARVRELFDELAIQVEGRPVGTWELLDFLGRHFPGEGVLQAATKGGVKIFIPAFTDSELALDLGVHRLLSEQEGKPILGHDPFVDLDAYRDFCEQAAAEGKELGIFTIGGGAPRNWAQQVGPYIDVLNTRMGANKPRIRFKYGVRVCPDPPHYGHLSGCTYSEGVSWGKFVPASEGGRYAEVLTDATIGWPLLVRAMIERGL